MKKRACEESFRMKIKRWSEMTKKQMTMTTKTSMWIEEGFLREKAFYVKVHLNCYYLFLHWNNFSCYTTSSLFSSHCNNFFLFPFQFAPLFSSTWYFSLPFLSRNAFYAHKHIHINIKLIQVMPCKNKNKRININK